MAITTTHERYGVPLSLAIKKASASKYKRKAGFSYPLVDSLTGVVTGGYLKKNAKQTSYFNKSYGLELIKNNLRQLFLTEKGERVMLPDYGLQLSRFLFEPVDETTFFLIKADILQTIEKYFSIVSPISIRVYSDNVESDRNRLLIELTLQLMDESLEVFDTEVTLG